MRLKNRVWRLLQLKYILIDCLIFYRWGQAMCSLEKVGKGAFILKKEYFYKNIIKMISVWKKQIATVPGEL